MHTRKKKNSRSRAVFHDLLSLLLFFHSVISVQEIETCRKVNCRKYKKKTKRKATAAFGVTDFFLGICIYLRNEQINVV